MTEHAATLQPTRHDVRWVRILYLFYIGGTGFLFPFWGLFLRRQGLTGTEIGFISTVMSTAILLAATGWGRLSDRSQSPKRVIQVALLMGAGMTLVLRFQSGFWPLLIAGGLYGAAIAGIQPMLYALAYDLTERLPSIGFGSIRVWGSIGWVVMVLVSGWAIERADLSFGFYGQTVAFLLTTAAVFYVRFSPQREEEESESNVQLRAALNRDLLFLAAAISVGWMARVGPIRFEGIYLEELGAGEFLIGVASMVGAVVEIPAMFLADRLVSRHSYLRILRICFVIELIVQGSILLRPAVATIVLVRGLGGLSFSLYSVALVGVVGRLVPEKTIGAMLALFTITLPSLMEIIGSPLTGLAFDRLGAYWLYAIALGCNAGAFVLLNGVRTRSKRGARA